MVRITVAGLLVTGFIAAGCARAETRNASVTTSSPAGTSTAPSAASTEKRDDALMRVVHAVPAGTQLDLYAGDLALFEGLGFKSVTPYRAVDGTRHAFALRPAGMTRAKPLSINSEDLEDGDYYTAFAMPGDGGTPHLRVVNDPLDPPAGGKARIRVVHAADQVGTIDLRAAGTTDPLFDNIEFQTVGNYRDVAPMNGTVEVVTDTPGTVVTSATAHLEAGRFYTLVIVGTAGRVEAFLIEDALSQ